MIKLKKRKKFQKYYDKHEGPFTVMVLGKNGYWNKGKVIGISKRGFLIFSGYFVGDCFDAQDYMTIKKYNKKQMYLQASHNGKKEPVAEDVHLYTNLNY